VGRLQTACVDEQAAALLLEVLSHRIFYPDESSSVTSRSACLAGCMIDTHPRFGNGY
jgi:hypothetical protein